jgi:hypothetical protein
MAKTWLVGAKNSPIFGVDYGEDLDQTASAPSISPKNMKLKYIKKDRALLLTSVLLMLMLAAGLFSGIIGFTMGHAALKGVTQPDIRRSNKGTTENTKTRGLEVLPEKQLIADAQDIMGIDRKTEAAKFKTDEKAALVFPIESKDQGITMLIKSAKLEGNNLKLDIALSNQGSQPIKFNQGVLTIVGDKEQNIPFSAAGIPPSLAANGKEVGVKVLIAKTAIPPENNLTLRLTDVDRKLQIEAKDVPVGAAVAKPPIKISIPDGQLSTTEDKEDKTKTEKPASPSPTPKASAKSTPTPTAKAAPSKPPIPSNVAPPPAPAEAPPTEAPIPPAPTGDGNQQQ